MTNDEAIRDAVDKIDTVARWIKDSCAPPRLILCVGVLELAARDLKSILDKKEDQKDDK